MTLVLYIFILLAGVAILYSLWQYYYSLAEKELNKWASFNKYKIIRSKRCFWHQGPFLWKTIRGQEVYEIHVRDEQNKLRKGWLRISVPFLFGDKLLKLFGMPPISVIWDDKKPMD